MFIARLSLYKKLTRLRSARFAEYLSTQIPDGAHVLDFGCGNMYTSAELLRIKPSLTVTGLDVIRDQNLDESWRNNSRLRFVLLESRDLPFPDGTFDVAVALAALHHTDDPEYYLSELRRVIKATGAVILIEEMYSTRFGRLHMATQDWILNKLKSGVPIPLNFRSHDHYLEEFTRQGLLIECADRLRSFLSRMRVYAFKLRPVLDSPPRLVLKARQISMLMLWRMKRALASPITTCTPPG